MDWREKLFSKVLVKCSENGHLESVPTLEALADCVEDGEGAVCGIYFSFANISDSSDDFGLRLQELYYKIQGRLKVVQVVLWAHVGTPEGPVEREAGFRRALTGKPWFAVPFHDVETKVSIMKLKKILIRDFQYSFLFLTSAMELMVNYGYFGNVTVDTISEGH